MVGVGLGDVLFFVCLLWGFVCLLWGFVCLLVCLFVIEARHIILKANE